MKFSLKEMKELLMKKGITHTITLFCFLICLTGSIPCYGDTNEGKGMINRIIQDYVLYDTRQNFDREAETVYLLLDEAGALLNGPSVRHREWLQELAKEKFIHTAYILIKGEVFTVGNQAFSPDLFNKKGYSIDSKGVLHYIYADVKSSIFLDAVIENACIEEALSRYWKKPHTLILFDKKSGFFHALSGNGSLQPDSFDYTAHLDNKAVCIDRNQVFIGRNLGLDSADFYLLSLSPIKIGKRLYYVIGLIVLILSAILFIVKTMKYSLYTLRQVKRGVIEMAKDEQSKVISEIDREISDIIEEKEELSKTQEAVSHKTIEEEKRKSLENDGIFIKSDETLKAG